MTDLTARQRVLLEFIIQFHDEHGYPPSLREMGDHMGIKSTNGVSDHLLYLEKKGYIAKTRYKSRSLRVLKSPDGDVLDSLDGRIFKALRPLAGEDGFRPALERALVRLRGLPKVDRVAVTERATIGRRQQ